MERLNERSLGVEGVALGRAFFVFDGRLITAGIQDPVEEGGDGAPPSKRYVRVRRKRSTARPSAWRESSAS